MAAPLLHDLACVVHLHSTHSDGTGTVAQIVAAGARAGVDVVLLSDHDSLAGAVDEGWHGPVLLLVGEEVSPARRDHTLVFGADGLISPNQDGAGVVADAAAAGALSFAAHPFSRGSDVFRRLGQGMPHTAVDAPGLTGIELWSFVTDTAERVRSVREALMFALSPLRVVDDPPATNVIEWDRLCGSRRMVAIGGLDAHQIGVRMLGRVPLRLMGYARSFSHLRTHVLCSGEMSGEVAADRALVYDALAEGRCYLAMDALAPARGFSFWADGEGGQVPMGAEAPAGDWVLHARLPRRASVRLIRDGVRVASVEGAELDFEAPTEPGVYRVEASLPLHGRMHTWVMSNPVYLR